MLTEIPIRFNVSAPLPSVKLSVIRGKTLLIEFGTEMVGFSLRHVSATGSSLRGLRGNGTVFAAEILFRPTTTAILQIPAGRVMSVSGITNLESNRVEVYPNVEN